MTRLSRLIVRTSAWLVPTAMRARWREEWLGEIEAADRTATNRKWGRLRLVRGAPVDALLLRVADSSQTSLHFGWMTDVRHAARAIRRTPLQAATIVACLGIGATLTVVVFGVINAMLGGRLPGIEDRQSLVRVRVERARDRRIERPRVGEYQAIPPTADGIIAFAAEVRAKPLSVSAGGHGGTAEGSFVSGSYFSVLGTTPVMGRLLHASDDRLGAPPVAVIGHHFWQQRFGGSASAIGSTMLVTTLPFEIVGVVAAGFIGLNPGEISDVAIERGDIWLPIAYSTVVGDGVVGRPNNAAEVVARLEPAVAKEEAEPHLQPLVPAMNAATAVQGAQREAATAIRLRPFHMLFADENEPLANSALIGGLAVVPLLVLGIACANVAGIQLARAIGRTHELAVRVSLGASRARLVRLLGIETGMLALTAGGISWMVAREVLHLSAAALPIAPIADGRLFLLVAVLPLVVTLTAGVLPAWRATGFQVVKGLRLGPRVGRVASPRTRRVIVAAQMGVSVALLIGAGTLLRGLAGLPAAVGPAFSDVLIASVRSWDLGLDAASERSLREAIIDRLGTLPGAETVGLSPRPIFESVSRGGDGVCRSGDQVSALTRLASPAFFSVVRLPMRRGRPFHADDDATAVVVNEAFARRMRQASVIGSPVGLSGRRIGTIVGVVADNYERYPSGEPRPLCYVHWTDPANPSTGGSGSGTLTFFIRSQRPEALAPVVRTLLRDVDPRLGPTEIGTMPELMRAHYRVVYLLSDFLAATSAAAFGMAALGLFGIVAYGAALRMHEFGVRLALGARPANIAGALVRESLVVVLAGAVVGLVLALPITWLMSTGLSSARIADPILIASALFVLAVISMTAAARPVLRVTQLNPVSYLRAE